LLISLSEGCEPTNRIFYVDLEALPKKEDGSIDFSSFDWQKEGHQPLPIVKLVRRSFHPVSSGASLF
jgi:hypothetical protein